MDILLNHMLIKWMCVRHLCFCIKLKTQFFFMPYTIAIYIWSS